MPMASSLKLKTNVESRWGAQAWPVSAGDGALDMTLLRREQDPNPRSPESAEAYQRFRDVIGVDNMMWGSDYPHSESTFPQSRKIPAEILESVRDDEQAKIVERY
jgi:hypothetical protein